MRLVVLVLALIVLVTGCSARQDSGVPGGYVAGDGSATVLQPADREPAPDVSGTTVSGQRLALRDLPGPVVVNFWASWCGPCATEAPALQNVADAYAEHGVSVVGVNIKDQPTAARNFERDFGVRYPSWHDPAAVIAAQFGGIGPAALPSTIVLDSDHRVAVRLFGAVSEPQLAVHLDRLLDEETAA